jgi:hypothetical protein
MHKRRIAHTQGRHRQDVRAASTRRKGRVPVVTWAHHGRIRDGALMPQGRISTPQGCISLAREVHHGGEELNLGHDRGAPLVRPWCISTSPRCTSYASVLHACGHRGAPRMHRCCMPVGTGVHLVCHRSMPLSHPRCTSYASSCASDGGVMHLGHGRDAPRVLPMCTHDEQEVHPCRVDARPWRERVPLQGRERRGPRVRRSARDRPRPDPSRREEKRRSGLDGGQPLGESCRPV